MKKQFKSMECPVCHKFYFSELTEEDITYGLAQQCTQCGWNYDLEQVNDPDLVDLVNGMSLKEYKKKYKKLIAKDPGYNYLEANYTPIPHTCPVCGKHFISITIIPWTNEDQKVDVYLTCNQCKSRNVFSKNVIINP